MNNYSIPLPWHTQQWQQLYRSHQEGRLSHALLLAGQMGLGKSLFALHFAKTLLCKQPKQSRACQACRDCILVAAGTHPDLSLLTTEKSTQGIKIDQIRDITDKLSHTSQATYKIIVINPADSLLVAASQALLKSLEEPSCRSLFILLTEKREHLLPTIRSRCQLIRFNPPKKSLAMAWLAQQLPASAIDTLYHLSSGAPLLAVRYAEEGYPLFYADLVHSLAQLVNQTLNPIRCAAKYLKTDIQQLLSALLNLLNELLKCQLLRGYTATIDSIAHLARVLSTDFLLQYYDRIMILRARMVNVTLNVSLVLDDLLSRWALQGKSC
ncbi:DNA polymerase III subunit delta' [Rickettsiella grylli]|uniref:DNA polymerase III subunit delta' n=1 Tax=Rickettsiella grylli TaxID=59196 RepID=UPI0008FCE9EA|nr:DNA polymerase III subunit delta' [Rickettsiella grylli]OJA00786.1 DNA polymerase III subunit delta' [Rickettsiella grylli]